MVFALGEQTSEIKTRSLGKVTRNMGIKVGEDVDVLRGPGSKAIFLSNIVSKQLKSNRKTNEMRNLPPMMIP